MTTAICIASGPSLTQEDVDYCRGKGKVYAVNDVYKLAPWADVLYACDHDWWHHHKGVEDFAGERWTINKNASFNFLMNHVGGDITSPWSKTPGVIATGGNSGFQALNLAVLQGATKVILLGYDMRIVGGKRHFFGDHPVNLHRESKYEKWCDNFKNAAPLIPARVINCTPGSALKCFKKADLRDTI